MRGKTRPVALALALAVAACRHEAKGPLADFTPAPSRLNVVLITLDTLRADRLGCYGFPGDSTPHLDQLASEGVLFEQATSTVPLTLPSHATILTGLLPPHHGVRDNGGVPVAETRMTLAERYKAAGYATGGFVGAWVLERRFGLAQGFDRYSDRFALDQVQKRGDAVVDDALAWIDEVRDRRLFAWVHLFDPHLPYDPPEPFRSRFASDPYQGEVAFTDALVGRLLARLRERGLLERTLVVVAADHGESLGEHGEPNHGFFVYDATVAVPLLVRTPWGLRGRSRTQASLADVFPTVLELAGLPAEPGIDGQSLVPAVLDPARDLRHVAYSESLYPRLHYGWHELRALRDGAWKLVDAPRVELYDLARDPGEKENLARAKARTAEEMRLALRLKVADDDPAAAARPSLDPETQQRLAALGYVGGAVATDPKAALADPKDKVAVFGKITAAKEADEAGRHADAIAMMRAVIEKDADVLEAHLTLGGWLLKSGRADEAIAPLKRALALKPDDERAVMQLVSACRAKGRREEALGALDLFAAALEKSPENPHAWYQLAVLRLEMGRTAEAEGALRRALDADPRLAAAHGALGALALDRGDVAQSERELAQALAIDPGAPTVRYNLARVRAAQGKASEAEALYRAELADNPAHGRAHFNLARLLKDKGDQAGYLAELRRGVEEAPRSGPCHFLLAHEEMRAGRLAEAERLARRGLEVDGKSDTAPLGYFVLADVYNRQGQREKAQAALARARSLEGGRPRSGVGSP
jgi:arylsulfatase A-like enzyme/Flp pilus assembly protein TadD